MSAAIVWLLLIVGQALVSPGGVQAKRFLGVGQRIDGDQLLLKDVQHSRPAGISEPASVVFNYNIVEPITCIEIVSDENISAIVKFSYTDSLVVGVVQMVATNVTEVDIDANADSRELLSELAGQNLSAAFDVTIMIFGYNETMLNVNPALLINRDTQYQGFLRFYDDEFINDNDDDEDDEDVNVTDRPVTTTADFEHKDKIIEIGERQEGDDLIYETYQTSPDVSKEQMNHTVIFYYIDSDYITYIKFVIFDHFADKAPTAADYVAPVAEYSHYSPGTFKATITDFNISSLFVQMFVYGYRGREAAPHGYKPFLAAADPAPDERTPHLTPLQRVQLLLMTGRGTTRAPHNGAPDSTEDEDDDDSGIRPEDMVPDHIPEPSIPSAALDQPGPVQQRLYAMLGLMLFAVA